MFLQEKSKLEIALFWPGSWFPPFFKRSSSLSFKLNLARASKFSTILLIVSSSSLARGASLTNKSSSSIASLLGLESSFLIFSFLSRSFTYTSSSFSGSLPGLGFIVLYSASLEPSLIASASPSAASLCPPSWHLSASSCAWSSLSPHLVRLNPISTLSSGVTLGYFGCHFCKESQNCHCYQQPKLFYFSWSEKDSEYSAPFFLLNLWSLPDAGASSLNEWNRILKQH